MIRATIDLPKQWGPLEGAAAQPEAAAAAARGDHAARGLSPRRLADAGAGRRDRDVPVVLMYAEQSAFIDTYEFLMRAAARCPRGADAADRVGPFRPARAARDRGRAHPRPPGGGQRRRCRTPTVSRPGRGALMRGIRQGQAGTARGRGARHRGRQWHRHGDRGAISPGGAFASTAPCATPPEREQLEAAAAARGVQLRGAASSTSPTATRIGGRGARRCWQRRAPSTGSSTTAASACGGAWRTAARRRSAALFETNVLGTIAVTRAVIPHMRAAGCGRIVTVSSVGGRVCGFGVTMYCASKFAQEGFGEGLAQELAPIGHPVGDRRAGDPQDHALVAPPRHGGRGERPRQPLPRPVLGQRGDRRQARRALADPPAGRGRDDRQGAQRSQTRACATSSGAAPRS